MSLIGTILAFAPTLVAKKPERSEHELKLESRVKELEIKNKTLINIIFAIRTQDFERSIRNIPDRQTEIRNCTPGRAGFISPALGTGSYDVYGTTGGGGGGGAGSGGCGSGGCGTISEVGISPGGCSVTKTHIISIGASA